MLLPFYGVAGRTSHNDFQETFVIIFVIPLWFYLYYFVVKLNSDTPAHTNDHALAFKGLKAFPKVIDNIPGNLFDALFTADNRLHPGPSGLKFFFFLDFLAFGCLFKFGVNFGAFFRL